MREPSKIVLDKETDEMRRQPEKISRFKQPSVRVTATLPYQELNAILVLISFLLHRSFIIILITILLWVPK